MSRVVKKAAVRRTELLDAAQQLFMSRGYDATTVNDIIDAVGLSKGAFYHHFSSKEEVLQALTWRMADEGLAQALPVLQRRDRTPIERLNDFFGSGNRYRLENAPALRALTEVLFRDSNLRLRIQSTEQMIERITPALGDLLEEGRQAGVFSIDEPRETARILLHLGTLLHGAFAEALRLAPDDPEEAVALSGRRIDACERASERLLGIPRGGLKIVDVEIMAAFFKPASPARKRARR